ncbi:hypothetical protein Aple_041230 [Acrocarpospora pleiomorpha]|uniref:L,D-TPase catalytic domain-containing protein n=1 Tax=Acrocarpospora pleiomorpha TaxID=90975 RepID=A0A5M3XI95_9ACTN|nr:Ig-like domain-containing protein [Acrocarpospora pleiomorpha]GES21227.1 hypothetical protein Aple_041230 [Acrocarpospora pleiomorpha]
MRRVIVLVLAILCSGCTSVTAQVAAPIITISPRPDDLRARPDLGLVVRVRHGTLTGVTAFAGSRPVPGIFNGDRTAWRSTWTLTPGIDHVVNVSATGAGGAARQASRFRTLPPSGPAGDVAISPLPGETVGVGMPIVVTFNTPVTDRAAIERALELKGAQPVEGAWHWTAPTEVVYRPRRFWRPRQQIILTAHLGGARLSPGVYGTADRTVTFTIGRKLTSTVDTLTHKMIVRRDGAIVQRMPISAGRATSWEYTTTSGMHLVMDKGNPVRMVSPGRRRGEPGYYNKLISHAVRISNSGEYVHAFNNIWAQGRQNVSHGCVNASPAQAAWFYTHSLRGDPVLITGTKRVLDPDNGWGFWQLSWQEWLAGSALHAPTPVNSFITPPLRPVSDM